MKQYRSGSPVFGDFDITAELKLLCMTPTYADLFAPLKNPILDSAYSIPSLSVYRSKREGLGYRGHAKLSRNHIHLTIGTTCKRGEALELIAHELAHHISNRKGYDIMGARGHRGKFHHLRFDEVLRTLIRERHGIDLPVGERKGRYDYSWRVARHLCENTEDGDVYLCSLEVVPALTRKNQRRVPAELWGWTMEQEAASLRLQTNQCRVLDQIICTLENRAKIGGYDPISFDGNVMRIPLNYSTVTDLIRWLLLAAESNYDQALSRTADRLSQRISSMYQYVCQQQNLKAAGSS